MKKCVKQAVDELLSLDCRLDHDDRKLRSDRWRFTHPNAPDELFTISTRSSETACRNVVRRAKIAAGLATSDSVGPRKPKIDARRKAEREAERLRREAAIAAKDAERIERENARMLEVRRRQVSSLDRMMRGGAASGTSSLPPEQLFTIPQLVDELDTSEAALKQAVEDEALVAYMCSGVVKIKGADAMAWARRHAS